MWKLIKICRFLVDNLQAYIFSPARTTVGFGPKFVTNRKFFANLISTKFYKTMINQDELTVKKNLVKKMEFCDEMIMDENMLKEFYDREVDQSKLRKWTQPHDIASIKVMLRNMQSVNFILRTVAAFLNSFISQWLFTHNFVRVYTTPARFP